MLDRIDLHVEVPAVRSAEITSARSGETSAEIRARVVGARGRQQARFASRPRITYDRILKVGRTIADLAGSAGIRADDLSEAIQ